MYRSLAVRLLFWTIVLLTGAGVAFAQPYNSQLGRFQVDQKKGCAPLSITITNLSTPCTLIQPCAMNFGDGTPTVQNTFTHTYTTPGTYTLSIVNAGSADAIEITVVQNIQPPFEIHTCSGNSARIKVVDNNYQQYEIDFTNNGIVDTTLAYSNNIVTGTNSYGLGTFTVSVRGRDLYSANNCTPTLKSFTPAALTAPFLTNLTMIDNANLSLNFITSINTLYRLEISINGGPFQVYKTFYGGTTESVGNLQLDQNYYCFRLAAFSPCDNVSTYATTILCSNNLVLTPQSRQITITSNIPAGPSLSINRTSSGSTPVTMSGPNPFPDVDVECKIKYCYKVTASYASVLTPSGPVTPTSISLEKCETAFSTLVPTAIDDVTATIGPPGATMAWTQDPLFEPSNGYRVLRSGGSGPFVFYTNASASPFVDNIYTTEGKFCYQLDYLDKCDVQSDPGASVCPVQLYGVLDASNAVTLYWSKYRGWKMGVDHYVLEKYDVNGALIESLVQSDTAHLDNTPDPVNQYLRYVIKAIPTDPAMMEAISNERIFIRSSNLYYPTAFTPNKNNLNETFIVQGQYIEKLKLTIFDRWGVALYSTEKNEPWDGSSNGRIMPPSTYIWKAEILDRAGQNYSREGTVALIR